MSSSPPISMRSPAGVMEAAPRLRLVIVPFIGTDKIDILAASRLGILVANSPTAGELHRGGGGHGALP